MIFFNNQSNVWCAHKFCPQYFQIKKKIKINLSIKKNGIESCELEDIYLYIHITKKNFGLIHVYFLYTVFREKTWRNLFNKKV